MYEEHMATEIFHNKLVRDLIPEVLSKKGIGCQTRILSEQEFRPALIEKLQEEVAEYLRSQTPLERIEELSDILEVIFALLKQEGYTIQDLEQVREKKFQTRGGFSRQIFLEKTIAIDPLGN
jgi:predicted house-cleaning noncanonical NTP pyrophosphatase (MazG superfamily)